MKYARVLAEEIRPGMRVARRHWGTYREVSRIELHSDGHHVTIVADKLRSHTHVAAVWWMEMPSDEN